MQGGAEEPEIPEHDQYHKSLKSFVERVWGPSFSDVLLKEMRERNIEAPELYNNIGMDRRLFNKIVGQKDYRPNKNSIILICLGLHMNLDETNELLRIGGYYLSNRSRRDLVVMFCIEQQIYDVFVVDGLVREFHEPGLCRF